MIIPLTPIGVEHTPTTRARPEAACDHSFDADTFCGLNLDEFGVIYIGCCSPQRLSVNGNQ